MKYKSTKYIYSNITYKRTLCHAGWVLPQIKHLHLHLPFPFSVVLLRLHRSCMVSVSHIWDTDLCRFFSVWYIYSLKKHSRHTWEHSTYSLQSDLYVFISKDYEQHTQESKFHIHSFIRTIKYWISVCTRQRHQTSL